MQLLVYRKSLLTAAGIQPPTTVDELLAAAKKLTTDKVKGLFVGNDGGVGILGGPALWSAGLDYLKEDNTVRLRRPGRGRVAAQAPRTVHLEVFVARGTDRLVRPVRVHPGPDRDAVHRSVDVPADPEGVAGRLRRTALAEAEQHRPARRASRSVPIGSAVSAKSKNVDAAKKFVKWLWVDQTDKQLDWAQSYGFHIPARKSLAEKADKLKSGPAADAVKFVNENGHAQTPLLWTPKVRVRRTPTRSTGSSRTAPTRPPRSRRSRRSWRRN